MKFHSGDHYLWRKMKKYLGGSEDCSCRIKKVTGLQGLVALNGLT
jgi:hypothetical protein